MEYLLKPGMSIINKVLNCRYLYSGQQQFKLKSFFYRLARHQPAEKRLKQRSMRWKSGKQQTQITNMLVACIAISLLSLSTEAVPFTTTVLPCKATGTKKLVIFCSDGAILWFEYNCRRAATLPALCYSATKLLSLCDIKQYKGHA